MKKFSWDEKKKTISSRIKLRTAVDVGLGDGIHQREHDKKNPENRMASGFLSCFELKPALAELGGVLRARVNVLFLAIILR